MILKVNGKIAAKTLVDMNKKTIVCVNCKFFENSPTIEREFDCYGMLDDVLKTGCLEGLRVEKIVLDWFEKVKNDATSSNIA